MKGMMIMIMLSVVVAMVASLNHPYSYYCCYFYSDSGCGNQVSSICGPASPSCTSSSNSLGSGVTSGSYRYGVNGDYSGYSIKLYSTTDCTRTSLITEAIFSTVKNATNDCQPYSVLNFSTSFSVKCSEGLRSGQLAAIILGSIVACCCCPCILIWTILFIVLFPIVFVFCYPLFLLFSLILASYLA